MTLRNTIAKIAESGSMCLLLVVIAFAATACTSRSVPNVATQKSSAMVAPTTASGSSAVPTENVGRVPAAVTLPCGDAIGVDPPAPGLQIVLGVVGLPTSPGYSALAANESGLTDPAARLFAKTGLTVKAGTSFRIIVPAEFSGRARIGWGSPGEMTTQLSVNACPAAAGSKSSWLDYAGGYWVRAALCLPLIVEANGRQQRVAVGIGTVCPGQKPVPSV